MLVPLRQMLYPHYVGGFFDFPDRPPSFTAAPKEDRPKVRKLLRKIDRRKYNLDEKIAALKAALIEQEIQYMELYADWLKYREALKQQKVRKKRNRNLAIRLLLDDL